MIITPETKLKTLVDKYQYLINFISTLSPEYMQLKNPETRETMLKIATIKRVAAKKLIEAIK